MNEDRIIQPGIGDAAHYNAPLFKTFIENPGQLLAESLNQYFKQNVESHCDLKFYASDSRFVRVHRVLFAAISPFLRDLILELDPFQCKELSVFLPDMRYVDLQHLVSLVYTGEICLNKRTRGTLIKWLEILGIPMILNETTITAPELIVDSNNKLIYVHDEGKRQRREKLVCQLCRKSFKTESYMKSHLLTHTGEKPHKCLECGKQFRYKDSLKAHMRDHTGDKFKCRFQKCDMEFNRIRDLKDHENIHPGETTTDLKFAFACNICDAKFLRKKQLSNHKEVHREVVEPCKMCGKVLKNVACLRSHMKNHRSLKNFSCGTCGKAFKRNFDLTVHLRIHSGSRPYQCDICRKTFSLSSTLAKHKRFHEDKLGKMKNLSTTRNNRTNTSREGAIQSGTNTIKPKGEMSVVRSSKQSVMSKEMEMSYFTQNTIADALIDLSQSSNIVLSGKDGYGSEPFREGNPR